jgi:quercetin dioxygenase-like cupin family protein
VEGSTLILFGRVREPVQAKKIRKRRISMGLINNLDRPAVELAPGVLRRPIVGRDTGASSLTTSYVTVAPGATTPIHRHQVEEAMFLSQGEGLAILGDETFPMKAPATLLAPPGVKHGFINNSSAPVVFSGNFPVLDVETEIVG